LDADVIIQKKHLHDMLARMQANPKVAAVSCAYVPHNTGFFPIMQDMEYVMLTLIQGSYNTFGAIALRGGCFIVKKSLFTQVGKFSPRVMTEDMDLAFKLNNVGYKVEQAFHRVSTFVPETLKTRYKQKIRRNSGGAHCFIKYPQIWLRNPLHLIMIMSFNILMVSMLFQAIQSYDLFVIIFTQEHIRQAFRIVFNLKRWLNLLFVKTSFSLLSLPYVLPLLNIFPFAKQRKNLWKILLIIPYSIIYIPMYTYVGIIGLATGIWNYKRLEKI
jgi:cellulose synthase/poly-beta-1,6-N-acetylglucosamine synthase-like glycosyltransferase